MSNLLKEPSFSTDNSLRVKLTTTGQNKEVLGFQFLNAQRKIIRAEERYRESKPSRLLGGPHTQERDFGLVFKSLPRKTSE